MTRARRRHGLIALTAAAALIAGIPTPAFATPPAGLAGVTTAAQAADEEAVRASDEERVRAMREVGLAEDDVLLGYTDCNLTIAIWNHVKANVTRTEVRIAAEQAFTGSEADCTAFLTTEVFAANKRDTERNLRDETERRARIEARRAAAAAMNIVAGDDLLLATDKDFASLISHRATPPDWAKVKAAAVAAYNGTPEQQAQFIATGMAEAAAEDKRDKIARDQEASEAEKKNALARAAKQFAAERVGIPVTEALLSMPDEDFVREVANGTADGSEVQAAAVKALRSSNPADWKAFIDTGVHEAKARDRANELAERARRYRALAQDILTRADRDGNRNLALAARVALAGSDTEVEDFVRVGQGQVPADLPNILQAGHSGLCLGVDSKAHAVQVACGTAKDQGWKMFYRPGGYLEIKNNLTGNCLAISGNSKVKDAHAVSWRCNGGKEQQWVPGALNSSLLRLKNNNSNLCLAIDKASHAIQAACTTGAEQGWAIRTRGLVNLESGTFNADAYEDLLAVDVTTGKLYLYPGTATGAAFRARIEVGSGGWNGMDKLVVGKFNRDGHDDLIAVEKSTGKLFLYAGSATGQFGGRVEVGTGWNGYSELSAGKFNRDEHDDLIAVENATGKLWLYPGTPAGGHFGARVMIGSGGWNNMDKLADGKIDRDAYEDVIAVDNTTAKLWLYPGTADGKLGTRVEIGGGWNHMTELTVGKFNGDEYEDLITAQLSTGKLFLYPGTPAGGRFGTAVEVAIGG